MAVFYFIVMVGCVVGMNIMSALHAWIGLAGLCVAAIVSFMAWVDKEFD